MRSSFAKVGLASCLILAAATGCVTDATATDSAIPYRPVELTGKSNEALRSELERSLRQVGHFNRSEPFQFSNWKISRLEMGEDYAFIAFADASSILPGVSWKTEHFQYSFRFQQLAETCNTDKCSLPGSMSVGFPTAVWQSASRQFHDVAYTLGLRAQRQHDEEQARFTQLASQARSHTVSALPENLRRLIVQAEAQRQEKDYTTAAATFRKLIRQDPVAYPAAHFNLALLYEMLGDYPGAIESMQRYLVLQPQAADARAAQDKIYEWEMKAARR